MVGGEGPQHQHVFIVEVEVQDRILGTGRGASKKAAEQQAAGVALARLDELAPATKRKTP
ncbi:ribonuclease III [compost metagenome]